MNSDLSLLYRVTRDRFCAAGQGAAALDEVLAVLRSLWDEAEGLLANEDAGDRSLIACGPGCGTCCVVNVASSFPEAVAVARYLVDTPAIDQDDILERLHKLWRDVRGIEDGERVLMHRPCAFLDAAGHCLVHPVRPLICRSVTSTDPELCRAAVVAEVCGCSAPIVMHQFQQRLYETLFTALTAGLALAGWDDRSFQLSGLVRFLLRHPREETPWGRDQPLTWADLYP
ncbi:YkgJ family cysteine cluster protein [Pelobacter seleniigenes]|uniref:YkgJ family cysteine cluster protein n=1 Tax=Pelobacter seleniigenes TaxID=407188 RepID=UPI00068E0D99|nr:YkgJ family cysteine cluster protein [Pelobacter seleniigenes]